MDEQNSVGYKILLFFRDLLGSRLSAHLEEELMRVRNDYETRLQEREIAIADLKERLMQMKAKADIYELALMRTSSLSSLFSPEVNKPQTFHGNSEPEPGTWEAVQANFYKEQEEEAAREKEMQHGNDEGRQAQEQ